MFRRIFITALLAGFLGGLGISVVQEFTTTPIILHAEEFETKAAADRQNQSLLDLTRSPLFILAYSKDAPAAEDEEWSPADGLERTVITTLANILSGIGFALILVACIALSGSRSTAAAA